MNRGFDFTPPIADVRDVSPVGLPYQRASATSKAAAVQAQTFASTQQASVYAWIAAQGEQGGTQRECHEQTGIERASLSPRFLELETESRIIKVAGVVRNRCAVYRVRVK